MELIGNPFLHGATFHSVRPTYFDLSHFYASYLLAHSIICVILYIVKFIFDCHNEKRTRSPNDEKSGYSASSRVIINSFIDKVIAIQTPLFHFLPFTLSCPRTRMHARTLVETLYEISRTS